MTVVVLKSCVLDSSVIALMNIVDEGLGIDPAVEFGRVAEPFHQSLRSPAYFTALQNQFHAVQFIGGYRHLMQLQFVEDAVQHFEIFDQSVHGGSEGGTSCIVNISSPQFAE